MYNVGVMHETNLTERVCSKLLARGFNGRILSLKHLDTMVTEIRNQLDMGLLSEEVYREYRLYFLEGAGKVPTEARSIIITAAPQPQLRVGFKSAGRQNHFIIPPTYTYETDNIVERLITDTIGPSGYKLFPTRIPLKLAAIRSGLASYGRNNIAYVEGMGSFHRLKAFLSDMPVESEDWHKLTMLKQCNDCIACIKKCPTGAISSDNFVIRQDRCLTFHNERLAEFPEWISESWHNYLIGCMYCQKICPANRRFKNWEEHSVDFSESETEYILKSDRKQLKTSTKKKLEIIGLLDDFEVLQRNLKLLIKPR
jgi:epoxyqueuosine reductase